MGSILEMISGFFRWIAMYVALLGHWAADQWWAPILGAVFVGLVLLHIAALDKLLRMIVAENLKVPESRIALGAAHAAASWGIVTVGGIHLGINLLGKLIGWFSPYSEWHYGLEAVMLGWVGLDKLSPMPFIFAFPLALLLYSYVYGCLLYFHAFAQSSEGKGPVFYLKMVFNVLLAVFSLFFMLAKRVIKSLRTKKKKAADSNEAEGDEVKSEVEEQEEEEDTGEPTLVATGDTNERLVPHGHIAVTTPDRSKNYVRLLERYQKLISPYAGFSLCIVIATIVVLFIARPKPHDLNVDLAPLIEAYQDDIQALSEKDLATASGTKEVDLEHALPLPLAIDLAQCVNNAGRSGGACGDLNRAQDVSLALLKNVKQGRLGPTTCDPGRFYDLADDVAIHDPRNAARIRVNGAICELAFRRIDRKWARETLTLPSDLIEKLPKGARKIAQRLGKFEIPGPLRLLLPSGSTETPAEPTDALPPVPSGQGSTTTGEPTQPDANQTGTTGTDAGELPIEQPPADTADEPTQGTPTPEVKKSGVLRLIGFVLNQRKRLQRLKEAAEVLQDTGPDEAFTASYVTSMMHSSPGHEAVREQMLKSAVENINKAENKLEHKQDWLRLARLLQMVSSHAQLLLNLHRYEQGAGTLEDFRDNYLSKVELSNDSCIPEDEPAANAPDQAPHKCAFLALIDKHLSVLWATSHHLTRAAEAEVSAKDSLGRFARKQQYSNLDRLSGIGEPSESDVDSHRTYKLRYFGPIHAGFSAGLLLFLFGFWRSSKTPVFSRSNIQTPEKEAPQPAPKPEEEDVLWETIVGELKDDHADVAFVYEPPPFEEKPSEAEDVKGGVPSAGDVPPRFDSLMAAATAQEDVQPTVLPSQPKEAPEPVTHVIEEDGSSTVESEDEGRRYAEVGDTPEAAGEDGEERRYSEVDDASGDDEKEAPDAKTPGRKHRKPRAEPLEFNDPEMEKLLTGGWPAKEFLAAFFDKRLVMGRDTELFLHQRLVSKKIDAAIAETKKTEEFHSVLLSSPANSGRTTSALFESVRAMLQRGETVLYLSADQERSKALAHDFDEVRKQDIWGCNMQVFEGVSGLTHARNKKIPIQLLFADIGTIMREILPLAKRVDFVSFVQSLGLVIVEDVERLTPARAANTAFVMRRLSELLRRERVFPVTMVTSQPVIGNEENFVRSLLGPFGQKLDLIPASADSAPTREWSVYLIDARRAGGTLAKRKEVRALEEDNLSMPHRVSAIVQAYGVAPSLRLEEEAETQWPSAHVGYQDSIPKVDPNAVRIYRRAQVASPLELADQQSARAVVIPLTGPLLPNALSKLSHCGIVCRTKESEHEDADGDLKVLGIIGPEPVDRWMLREFFTGDVDTAMSDLAEWSEDSVSPKEVTEPVVEDLAAKWFEAAADRFKPERVLALANAEMNLQHLEQSMVEIRPPGHTEQHLHYAFDRDEYNQYTHGLDARGQLDRSNVAQINRRDGSIEWKEHIWTPSAFGDPHSVRSDCYVNHVFDVRDRITNRWIGQVEADRAHMVFHEGKIFAYDGERFVVDSLRRQQSLDQKVIYCNRETSPRRSARIRNIQFSPVDMPDASRHRFGLGQPFFAVRTDVNYTETVCGVRLFHEHVGRLISERAFEGVPTQFDTEAFVMGFDSNIMDGPTEDNLKPADLDQDGPAEAHRRTLFGIVLLLRQVIPMLVKIDPEDLEIAFGFGAPPDGGAVGVDTTVTLEKDNQRHSVAWIAFFDRMKGGLGYAALLEERMQQGKLLEDIFRAGYDLLRWCEDVRVEGKLQQTLLADDLVNRQGGGLYAFATARNLEGASPFNAAGASVDRFCPEPAVVRETLERILGIKEAAVAAMADYASAADLSDWSASSDNKPAKQGLQDLLGLQALEAQLAGKMLLGFTTSSGDPWAIAFLCSLLQQTSNPTVRGRIERGAMGLYILARRRVDEKLPPPVVGREALTRFKPDRTAESISLTRENTSNPRLVVPLLSTSGDEDQLGLMEKYGELARDMGFITSRGELTQRGQALAFAMLTDTVGVAKALKSLERGALRGELKIGDLTGWIDALQCRELPHSARNVLAEGFHSSDVAESFGNAWRATMRFEDGYPRQPLKVDRQLKELVASTVLSGESQDRARQAYALHELDGAFRAIVNFLRAKAQKPAPFLGLAEDEECTPIYDRLLAAAEAVTPYEGELPAAAQQLLAAIKAPTEEGSSPSDATPDPAAERKAHLASLARRASEKNEIGASSPEAEEQVATVGDETMERAGALARVAGFIRTLMGSNSPFKTAGSGALAYIVVHGSWVKKHATDDSAGLRFGFDCLGQWIETTAWSEAYPPMGIPAKSVGRNEYVDIPADWKTWPRVEPEYPAPEPEPSDADIVEVLEPSDDVEAHLEEALQELVAADDDFAGIESELVTDDGVPSGILSSDDAVLESESEQDDVAGSPAEGSEPLSGPDSDKLVDPEEEGS